MQRDELGDLFAFLAICEERSFTRAAARLATSQSALSHALKRLEARPIATLSLEAQERHERKERVHRDD